MKKKKKEHEGPSWIPPWNRSESDRLGQSEGTGGVSVNSLRLATSSFSSYKLNKNPSLVGRREKSQGHINLLYEA